MSGLHRNRGQLTIRGPTTWEPRRVHLRPDFPRDRVDKPLGQGRVKESFFVSSLLNGAPLYRLLWFHLPAGTLLVPWSELVSVTKRKTSMSSEVTENARQESEFWLPVRYQTRLQAPPLLGPRTGLDVPALGSSFCCFVCSVHFVVGFWCALKASGSQSKCPWTSSSSTLRTC